MLTERYLGSASSFDAGAQNAKIREAQEGANCQTCPKAAGARIALEIQAAVVGF